MSKHPSDKVMTEENYGIKKCDKKKCVTCSSRLCYDDNVINHVTGEIFDLQIKGSCESKNCIYVIKCRKENCNYQYVGHTINQVGSRIGQHKSSIKLGGGSKMLRDHFTLVHSTEDMEIMPIEYLPENIKLKEREELEETWMLKLNTLFPYGLNVRCKKAKVDDSELIATTSKDVIYSKFDVVKINRGKRGGLASCTEYRLDGQVFQAATFFNLIFNGNLVGFRNIRTEICKLKKKDLKSLYIHSIGRLNDGFKDIYQKHTYLMIKDLCWFYLKRMQKDVKSKVSSSFLIVNFCNKFVEHVNLGAILKENDTKFLFPSKSDYFRSPTVSFKYGPTIRSKIVNYRKTHLEELDHKIMSCECASNKKFMDKHHGHVVTGNLEIIDNLELRNLLTKGLNHRDQVKPCKKKAYNSIKSGLRDYISKISKKMKKAEVCFEEWKHKVLEKVRSYLETKETYNVNSVLPKSSVKSALEKLHEKYVLVPTDKAANNLSIICKKFYLSLLDQEIGSSNFQEEDITPGEVIEKHLKFLSSIGIKLKKENKHLPFIYCTTKQHKNPIGFRYITAGYNSSLKQLSELIGICLKSMLHSAKNFSKYKNRFHKRNDFYVVDGHDDVLEFLYSCNISHKGRKNISTFDFSTLYTSIPHDQLKGNLENFVNRIFEFKEKAFITPNLYTKRGYFGDSMNSKNISFSKEKLLLCINYLIDNAYIIHRGSVYRQIVGIPMGTNSAPHMANIYLHVYEYEYINRLIENNEVDKLNKLTNIFRFQDDLFAVNDTNIFENVLDDVYPKEMKISKTNISTCKCSYLDLLVSIYKGKFRISLFDKRDDYKFKVFSYPYLDGNIPEARSYGIYISQLVRFCSINNTFQGFFSDVKNLTVKLCNQGFLLAALRNKFVKFYKTRINLWGKYGLDIYDRMISLYD